MAEAEEEERDRPGSISLASRPCDAGRRKPRVGDPGLEEVDEWGEDGEPVTIAGNASPMLRLDWVPLNPPIKLWGHARR